MKRRLLALLMTMVMLFSLLPVSALAEDEACEINIFSYYSDGGFVFIETRTELIGTEITENAEAKEGYCFLGWYSVTEWNEDGTPAGYGELLTAENIYTFFADEDISLAAVYESENLPKENDGLDNSEPLEIPAESTDPVRVVFDCDPEDAVITVYDPAQLNENGEPMEIEPEEDGTWLLMPGTYLYDAEREGAVEEKQVEFEVNAPSQNSVQIIEVKLGIQPTAQTRAVVENATESVGLITSFSESYRNGPYYTKLIEEKGKFSSDLGWNLKIGCRITEWIHGKQRFKQ